MHRLSGCSGQPSSLVVTQGFEVKKKKKVTKVESVLVSSRHRWLAAPPLGLAAMPRPSPTPRWINASGWDNWLLSFITDRINALTLG